jgi:hypothetical protein
MEFNFEDLFNDLNISMRMRNVVQSSSDGRISTIHDASCFGTPRLANLTVGGIGIESSTLARESSALEPGIVARCLVCVPALDRAAEWCVIY